MTVAKSVASKGSAAHAAAAAILIFAAAAKVEGLKYPMQSWVSFAHMPGVAMASAICESALASWLLFGFWSDVTRRLPAFCFAVFAVIALTEGIAGLPSCGCFGRLKTSPWITFLVDVIFATVLFIYPPHPTSNTYPVNWRSRLGFTTAIVLTVAVFAAARDRARGAAESEVGLGTAGSLVVLRPLDWRGQAFPLLAFIDIGEQLRSGRWAVFIFHSDCSTCRELMPRYREAAQSHPVAFVEMPPFDVTQDLRRDRKLSNVLRGTLADVRDWFANTPIIVLLENGYVRDIREGTAASGATVDWAEMGFVPEATRP